MMINIPDELAKQLEEIAQKEQRSVEDVVVRFVSAQIKQIPDDSSQVVEGFDIDSLLKAFDAQFEGMELPNDVDEVVANSREILHQIMKERLERELGEEE